MMDVLDRQMERWSERIRAEVYSPLHDSKRIATTVYSELVTASNKLLKLTVGQEAGPEFQDIADELTAFQSWMDSSASSRHPGIVRARFITVFYICYVYLGDAMFFDLKRLMPTNTLTHACASLLVTDKVRKFRHAIAHANWKYASDFSSLICWAWNDAKQLEQFKVPQEDLDFWQSLSLCVAYTFVTVMKDIRVN